MEWMILPYKRYADFSGRSRRKEYWMFTLLLVIVYIVLALVAGGAGAFTDPEAGFGIGGMLMAAFFLASFIPALAVQVRRFHDQGRSGWFVLLNFIPYIGSLAILVFMCLDGTRGPNEYGEDPKGRDTIDRRDASGGVTFR